MAWLSTRIAPAVLLTSLALVAIWWLASGHSLVALGSASMQPWAAPGDLLVQRSTPVEDVEVGAVVTVTTADGRVTNRVVDLTSADGATVAVLRGDASDRPDPTPYPLPAQVDVVTSVVAGLGEPLARTAPLLSTGGALLLLGWFVVARPARTPPQVDVSLPPSPVEPTGDVTLVERRDDRPAPLDPRIDALLATCEQLLDDGLGREVVRDLARVRVCEVLRLPSVERSGPARTLDDGARFYVLALVDADADALAIVPQGSARRRTASAAVDRWWASVVDAVPEAARTHLAPALRP